jgi:hypothetical protein
VFDVMLGGDLEDLRRWGDLRFGWLQDRIPLLNGVVDSHGFGVFAAFIVPTGDGGEMAWSAAAPRR